MGKGRWGSARAREGSMDWQEWRTPIPTQRPGEGGEHGLARVAHADTDAGARAREGRACSERETRKRASGSPSSW